MPYYRLTEEEILERLYEHFQGYYEYPEDEFDDVTTRSKINAYCPKHGWFKVTLMSHLRGTGCKDCGYERTWAHAGQSQKLTYEYVLQFLQDRYPDFDFSRFTEYNGAKAEIAVGCPKHGWFTSSWDKLRKTQYGCESCSYEARSTTSFNMGKTEDLIEEILLEMGYNLDRQVSLPGLVYKKALLLDFYIKEHRIAIEYDGAQHWDPDHYLNRKEGTFELRQLKDSIKDQYCQDHDIYLIRIPETVDDIEQYLRDCGL